MYCVLVFRYNLPKRCYRHGGVSYAFDSVLLRSACLRLLGPRLLQTVSESTLEAAVTWISMFLSQLDEIERHVDEYSSTAVSCARCYAQCHFMAMLKHWTQHRTVVVSALVHTGGPRNFIAWCLVKHCDVKVCLIPRVHKWISNTMGNVRME
jgi:hypothetical protein